jgi:hypothetical protein
MKLLFYILFLSVFYFCSCSDKLRSLDDTATEVTNVNGEELSFNQKITKNGVDFFVALAGTGDIRFLDIRASKNGVLLSKINDETEGMIFSTMITDLNTNSKPELLLLINSGDVDGRVSIIGFEYNGKIFKRFDMPIIEDELYSGFSGRDYIYIQGSNIIREFNVDNQQAGGFGGSTRRLVYALDENLNLTVLKQVNLK